jgi:hypothetical protein
MNLLSENKICHLQHQIIFFQGMILNYVLFMIRCHNHNYNLSLVLINQIEDLQEECLIFEV